MQQTETYKLNLIDPADVFSPDPLNDNARKLDAALAEQKQTAAANKSELDAALAGKAPQSEITRLETALNSKAAQTEIGRLETTLTEQQKTITANKTEVDAALKGKAAQSEITRLETALNAKAAQSEITRLDAALNSKAPQTEIGRLETTLTEQQKTITANKTEVDAALKGKAAQSEITRLETALNGNAQKVETHLTAVDAGLDARPRFASGSYTGTGKYGEANPCTLTFSFPPKMVVIVVDDVERYVAGTVFLAGQTKSSIIGVSMSRDGTGRLYVSWPENGISWYTAQSPEFQFNESGYKYYYFALG